mmetsp:Transcript_102771/g.257781  ORF Transcript_102771/g.257781 Transcript_102771/m.257781 type:complete len:98 (+) Transcript_102771:61-354(+)
MRQPLPEDMVEGIKVLSEEAHLCALAFKRQEMPIAATMEPSSHQSNVFCSSKTKPKSTKTVPTKLSSAGMPTVTFICNPTPFSQLMPWGRSDWLCFA